MKKLLAILLGFCLCFGLCGFSATAESSEDSVVSVYVNIVDDSGEIYGSFDDADIGVTDRDGDGVLTVNDALYAAHDEYHIDGAQSYATENAAEGLVITKLWNVEGSSYGCYVNHLPAANLLAPIKDGDNIYAFCYSDKAGKSDKYCYFDKESIDATAGEEITLTLSYCDFDSAGNPVFLPLKDATIIVGNEKTEFKTNKNGQVTLQLEGSGQQVISAEYSGFTITPPVCVVNLPEEEEEESVFVYLAIADSRGELVVVPNVYTHVTDQDGDGMITVSDALFTAHEENFEGGAKAGYATETTEDGIFATKLWGNEGGGNVECYVNHESVLSLEDELGKGDFIYAFFYTDTENHSDKYSFFDDLFPDITEEGQLTLTLCTAETDEDYETAVKPLKNATITINGKETEFVTDEKGEVTLFVGEQEADFYLISAKSTDPLIIPPVSIAYAYGEDLTLDVSDSYDGEIPEAAPENESLESDSLISPATGYNRLNFILFVLLTSAAAAVIFAKKVLAK